MALRSFRGLRLPRSSSSWSSLSPRYASSKAYTIVRKGKSSGVDSLELKDLSSRVKGQLQEREVRVRFLAAGVNADDLVDNEREQLGRDIAGKEGVAVVESVGAGVEGLSTGDRVVCGELGLGTWREGPLVVKDEKVVRIGRDVPVERAATMIVGPGTAWGILEEANTKKGDWVLINGGEGDVAGAMVQIGASRGLRFAVIVNSGEGKDVERAKILGADIAVREEDLNVDGVKEILKACGQFKLAVDGIGGEAGKILKEVAGRHVATISHGRGAGDSKFSLTRWMKKIGREGVGRMIQELEQLSNEGKLIGWLKRVRFEQLKGELSRDHGSRKLVVMMDNSAPVEEVAA